MVRISFKKSTNAKTIAYSLLLAALVTPSLFAREVCIEAPDSTTEDALYENFDGSITVVNPRLSVEGVYRNVGTMARFIGGVIRVVPLESAEGLCRVYGKTNLVEQDNTEANYNDLGNDFKIAVLTKEGLLQGTIGDNPQINDYHNYYTKVTCR